MITRNDIRMRSSVRNISRENFDKYLQMFDTKNSNSNTISFKPKQQPRQPISATNLIYQNNNNNDENINSTVKLNRMFYGISDETTNVLNTLCNKNEEIASFLVNNNNENENNTEKQNINNDQWYQAIPINPVKNDDLSMIDDSINSDNDNYNDYYPESKFNRLLLNEADFSDDSYDDTDRYSNQGFEIKLSLLKLQQQQQQQNKSVMNDFNELEITLPSGAGAVAAPVKPLRTFEHDIYVEKKNLLTLDNNNNNNKRLSLNNNAERRILKLIQTNSNNDHIYETLPAIKLRENENPYGVLMRKNLDTTLEKTTTTTTASKIIQQSSKIALSEPNLSAIGKRNKKKAPPLGRLLNQLRKTISRKSLSSADQDQQSSTSEKSSTSTSSSSSSSSSSNDSNKFKDDKYKEILYLNANSRIKSHIYSDATEMMIEKETLFDYALIVGLSTKAQQQRNKSHSVDDLNKDEKNHGIVNKLNPYILWHFPENVNILKSIHLNV